MIPTSEDKDACTEMDMDAALVSVLESETNCYAFYDH